MASPMLGLPRALVAVLIAAVFVILVLLIPLPPPVMIGLIVVGLIGAGVVWLFG